MAVVRENDGLCVESIHMYPYIRSSIYRYTTSVAVDGADYEEFCRKLHVALNFSFACHMELFKKNCACKSKISGDPRVQTACIQGIEGHRLHLSKLQKYNLI